MKQDNHHVKLLKLLVYLFIAVTLSFASCSNNTSTTPAEELDHFGMEPMSIDTFNFLLKQITQKGDTTAYIRICGECYYFHKDEQLLYYALIMANKYNYGFACADIADLLVSINQETLEELDPRTRKLALYYALKARELGYEIRIESSWIPILDTLPPSKEYLNL